MQVYTTPEELLRVSDGSPSSLAPRPADRSSGVSAFESERTLRLEFTRRGIVFGPRDSYVVLDTTKFGPMLTVEPDPTIDGHWFIRPSDPTMMSPWIEQRGAYPLTAILKRAILRKVSLAPER